MKRVVSILFSIMMVVAVSFAFAGCTTGEYQMWGIKVGDKETKFKNLTEAEKELYGISDMAGKSYIKLKGNDTFVIYETQENKTNAKFKTEKFTYGTYAIYDQKLFIYFEPATTENIHEEWLMRDGKIYVDTGEGFSFIYLK